MSNRNNIIKCHTCDKVLKGRYTVYFYTYYEDKDDNCYCSYECLIDDLPWNTIKAKSLEESNIKCNTCGKKLKGNDKVYYNEFDDADNYCSYDCMVKDLWWDCQ